MPDYNPRTIIGDRYQELLDRLKRLETWEDRLDDAHREFVIDMLTKLKQYKEKTYISARQLNYLTRIEGTLDDGYA